MPQPYAPTCRLFVSSVAFAVLVTAACSKQESAAGSLNPSVGALPEASDGLPKSIDAQAAHALVAGGGVTVLDIRGEAEHRAGHIHGARNLDINASGFEAALAQLDRRTPYLVHCAVGSKGGRSDRAVARLKALGFAKIFHLKGGIEAWKKAKLAVVTK